MSTPVKNKSCAKEQAGVCHKRRAPLPLCQDLRRKPWRFQLRRGRLEAHALVLRSRRRGWTDDPNLLFIITDMSLDFAEWLPWAGQA